jgi:acetyl-CoA acyltransferase
MKEAYIIDGIRTPIGNYKGTLSAVRADDLGALVIKELVKRNPTIPKCNYGMCKSSRRRQS